MSASMSTGRTKFGPDAEYLPDRALDYRVDESKRAIFGASVRRLLPTIADDDLAPDLAGIRAKLQGPGEGFRDFVVAAFDAWSGRERPAPKLPLGVIGGLEWNEKAIAPCLV